MHFNPGKHARRQASLLYRPGTQAALASPIVDWSNLRPWTSDLHRKAFSLHPLFKGFAKHFCHGKHALRQSKDIFVFFTVVVVVLPSPCLSSELLHCSGHLSGVAEHATTFACGQSSSLVKDNCLLPLKLFKFRFLGIQGR